MLKLFDKYGHQGWFLGSTVGRSNFHERGTLFSRIVCRTDIKQMIHFVARVCVLQQQCGKEYFPSRPPPVVYLRWLKTSYIPQRITRYVIYYEHGGQFTNTITNEIMYSFILLPACRPEYYSEYKVSCWATIIGCSLSSLEWILMWISFGFSIMAYPAT